MNLSKTNVSIDPATCRYDVLSSFFMVLIFLQRKVELQNYGDSFILKKVAFIAAHIRIM